MKSEDEVAFTYEKKDGSLRKAIGTLKNIQHLIKGTSKENIGVFAYYDLQASSFRCFKIENLVAVF